MSFLALHPTGPWPSLGRSAEFSTGPAFPNLFHLVVNHTRGSPWRPAWEGENWVRVSRQMFLPRNSPQGTCLFSAPTQLGSQGSRQAGGCRALHTSQQGVL